MWLQKDTKRKAARTIRVFLGFELKLMGVRIWLLT